MAITDTFANLGTAIINFVNRKIVTSISASSTDTTVPSAKCVYDAIQAGSDITVDSALSTTSTNPVQNKVITTELNKKIEGISSSDVTTALGYTPYNSSNPSGYTSNKGTVTKVNNTSPDNSGNVTISIPSAVTESTVSGWGFTKNTGTVTSVNNVSPVNGDVTLSIPDVEAYTATEVQTLWGSI